MLPQHHQEIGGRRFQRRPRFRGIDCRMPWFEQNLEGRQFDGPGLKYESVGLVLDNAANNRFRQQRPQIFDETNQREILHALIVSSYIRRTNVPETLSVQVRCSGSIIAHKKPIISGRIEII